MIFGGAAAAAAIGGGAVFFRHQANKHGCNACITNSTAEVGTGDMACSKSAKTCKKYFFKLAQDCKEACSIQQLTQSMNSCLHQILQNQSAPMIQLIQNSNSSQELQPAVNFVNKLKKMESKTLSKFRFRKTLAEKIEQAIQEKQNKLRGVEPFNFGNFFKKMLRVAEKVFVKLESEVNMHISFAIRVYSVTYVVLHLIKYFLPWS